ncbi:MAG: HAD-IA family hydrolase [Bacteroidales bacterium]|nr:HAD-IA family hydrolase [Bacteroidales bacterium]
MTEGKSKTIIEPSEKAEGLIFDMDGTLIDSLEINWLAIDTALRRHDIVISRQHFIDMTGRSLEEIVRILVSEAGREDDIVPVIVKEKREIANQSIDTVKPIEIVADVARRYKGRIPMSVGTGSDGHRAVSMLRSTGLLDLFDHVVSADDVVRHKPDPETFLKCAELMGVAPEKCQVFEDGDTGLEAARAAGMMTCDVREYL